MRFLIVDDSSTVRRTIVNTFNKRCLGLRSSVYGPQSPVMTEDRGPKTVDRVHLIHAIAVRPPLLGLRRGS
jgi:hypothetical protein